MLDRIRDSKKNKTTKNKSENLDEAKAKKNLSLTDGAKSCKILLIDDESNAGWGIFWKEFLAKYKFEHIDDNLKILGDSSLSISNLSQDEIILLAENEILSFDPDVVLLDLRLDRIIDFDENSLPSNLTGIKIAKLITAKNRGTQVVITSASNKITSYLAASKDGLGVDGYVIKSIEDDTDDKINHIINTLNDVIPRSKFLKEVNEKLHQITGLCEYFSLEFLKKQQSNILRGFQLVYQKDLNFAYLLFYQIIESFSSQDSVFTKEKNNGFVYSKNDKKIKVFQIDKINHNPPKFLMKTKFGYADREYTFGEHQKGVQKYIQMSIKMPLILAYRYKNYLKTIDDFVSINYIRNNKCGHGKKDKNANITNVELIDLLNFIIYILDDDNHSDENEIH